MRFCVIVWLGLSGADVADGRGNNGEVAIVNANQPAFPTTRAAGDGAGGTDQPGLTQRDWFAGQALAGLLSRGEVGEYIAHDAAARFACDYADATLARLCTPPPIPEGLAEAIAHVLEFIAADPVQVGSIKVGVAQLQRLRVEYARVRGLVK